MIMPASTLVRFNQTREQLRMTVDSFQDLVSHLESANRNFCDQIRSLGQFNDFRKIGPLSAPMNSKSLQHQHPHALGNFYNPAVRLVYSTNLNYSYINLGTMNNASTSSNAESFGQIPSKIGLSYKPTSGEAHSSRMTGASLGKE
ncbi:hypothetical protein F5Y16DRAFT_420279 [Xylariaceae sp. FL0255]|nr:hypothetical protein F5Y16DRAFT_420279 [Xylariaceae sp. FL0255]